MANTPEHDFLAGGGEAGALMRACDWSRTPLGPPESWPQSLRTSVSTCLNCAFPILIWWGPELVKLYNDAYSEILGAKHPAALGAAARDVWPEIWDVIGPMLGGVMSRGEATRAEDLLLLLHRRGFGEECYFCFSYSPIRDETGGIGGVFCPVIETTGRVIGARRLNLLRDIAEQSADAASAAGACTRAIASIGEHGRHDLPFAALYLVDDAGLARLAGSAALEPGSPACPEAIRLDTPEAALLYAAVVNGSETVLVENPGDTFGTLPAEPWTRPPERVALLPLNTGGARAAGFMLAGLNPHRPLDEMRGFAELVAGQVATAIGKARAYEEERRRAEALAELDRAKTAFFSNISHEFRTPLTLMLGPLQEILGKPGSTTLAELRPLLETGNRNALRLQRLVNALLDFSRIEAGRLQARYRPTDLRRLTLELASSFESAMRRAGLAYTLTLNPLPQPIYVDTGMWEKIVFNLLSNAFKFTLSGGVRVDLSEQDGAAVLTVRDTGIGIAADDLPRVFERFHRIEGMRGRSHEGTGIGLALVSDLVRLHGGSVAADSKPDKGSVFTVRIPFGRAHLPQDRVSEEPGDLPGDMTDGAGGAAFLDEVASWLDSDPADRSPEAGDDAATILLAEDNADMRSYVRRLLQSAGHRVIATGDGQAALDRLEAVVPDLVLSDVMMPRVDGLGLLRAIRGNPRLHELPVILLSARAGEEAQIGGLAADADDYIVKPFTALELLARVKSNLATAELRRRARLELRAANDTLERMVAERTAERDRLWELSEDLLVAFRDDGKLLRVSPSWTGLFGYTEAELLALDCRTIVHPDDIAVFRAKLQDMRRTRTPVRFENRIRAADSRYLWIAWTLSPDPNCDRMIGIGRDVTRDMAAREEIAQANRELRAQIEERQRVEADLRQMQRLEAIGQLTSGVAHDFNNLLTVITGAVELIDHDPDHPATPRRLGMIRTAAQRGATLTGQLLAFARKQRLAPKPIDLNEAVLNMSELLRGILGGTVRLEIVLKSDLWPVLADQAQLELVVLNLAINARDAMPVGGALTIETANAALGPPWSPHEPEAGKYVAIAVTDAGTGMPPEVLEHAFEPFFTTKGPGKGSGLGLAQVYGFAKQSGGGVKIDSRVGEGTAITVYLPRAERVPHRVPEAAAVREGAAPGQLSVLLVDDDSDVRDVTACMLEDFGYHVTPAAAGAAALDLLEGGAGFDLHLFDFAMPGMNGVELARQVEARWPGVPTVFITGYADMKALDHIGGRPVVQKPFRPDALAAALRKAIEGNGTDSNVVAFRRDLPVAR
nr:ATP-binding protein [uncultured Rhodopila sp.]